MYFWVFDQEVELDKGEEEQHEDHSPCLAINDVPDNEAYNRDNEGSKLKQCQSLASTGPTSP